jgi:hypothetical protein
MMQINNWALVLCLLLLVGSKLAANFAAKRGDPEQLRPLKYLRLGLGLSACSYLLRLMSPPGSLGAFVSLLSCLVGTAMIWIGFRGHLRLTRERMAQSQAGTGKVGNAPRVRVFAAESGLPYLNCDASQVLCCALAEAERQCQCVDTDHLLLGLLTVPGIPTGRILDRLGVKRENIRLALRQGTVSRRLDASARTAAEELHLTERARAVFSLAAQEAHRFNRPTVGSEHLLLGLVLMGTGEAASALFREGATVDGIRGEILKTSLRN